jgi:colicin import membrane protein
LVRDNFTANLLNYAGAVIRDNADSYKAQVELARKAGEPIYQHDKNQLDLALKAKVEAKAQAEAVAKAEAEAVAKAEAVAEAVAQAKAETEAEAVKSKGRKRELVPA